MRKFFPVLIIVLFIGAQPLFAQDAHTTTIELDEVSDNELTDALDTATDIELINKNDLAETAVPASVADEPVEAAEPAAVADETSAAAESSAAEEAAATEEPAAIAEETTEAEHQEEGVPSEFRNNKYFLESQRLTKHSEEAYEYGDYDTATALADDAMRQAHCSDEYITRRMNGESEEDVIASLDASLASAQYPATYTVQTWGSARDCLWNIAGRPGVYGNPRQWRLLYEANKDKLPEPNNPNLIEPGIVLTIPSLKGESRSGAWDPNVTYEPVQ